MQSRHLNELMMRLERIADIGVAEIRRYELLKWYGQERLTTSLWRDIRDKWGEVLSDEGFSELEIKDIPLFIGEADGVFVFLYGAKIVFDPADHSGAGVEPWLYPIDEWLKVKERKATKKTEKVQRKAA